MEKNNLENFFNLFKTILIPIHKEGFKFITIFALATAIITMVSSDLGLIALIATIWCIFFFRDPKRFTPQEQNLIVSPADGIINDIDEHATPPAELGLAEDSNWTKISIFLNVFNVHVNYIPAFGKIVKLNYKKGKFLSANLKEASLENERQMILLEGKNQEKIIFVQVAGLVARRIICDLKEGQEVSAGEKFGIIRFGSRVDIYLPRTAKIKALLGQTMIGAETIIAEYKI